MIVPRSVTNSVRYTLFSKPLSDCIRSAVGTAMLCALSLIVGPAWSYPGGWFASSTLHAQPPVNDSLYAEAMNAGYAMLRGGETALAIDAFERALRFNPGSSVAYLQLGYATLSLGRNVEAVRYFEEALARDESLDAARRQLGYLYADLGRTTQALAVFVRLRDAGRTLPLDHVAIGNLSAQLGDLAGAERAFNAARETGDPAVMDDANRGLRNIARVGVGSGGFLELYLAPFYQDRFDNTVGIGLLRVGLRGGGWWQPTMYGSLRATRDTRSTGGRQPVLFNDNTIIPALGVRVRPGRGGLVLYAEAGAALPLVDSDSADAEVDLRAGVNYTLAREHPLRTGSSPRLVTEVSGDATYYDRFDQNVIAYAQWRESLRFGRATGAMVDVYARGWGSTDSRGDFFNRVVEGGGGVAFHLPVGGLRTSVYLDLLRGRYLSEPPATSGLPRIYDDWRITVTTGLFRFFPIGRK